MRQTPLDKAIAALTARIQGLEEARDLLIDQRDSLRIPAKKPTTPVTTEPTGGK